MTSEPQDPHAPDVGGPSTGASVAEDTAPAAHPAAAGSAAVLVAVGILASRLVGFVRERVTAHYFGVGPHADVFRVALRAPNLLQNLLGEGTISAAFIPIYSRMLQEGRPEDAGRFAGAILGLLVALVTVLVTLGVLLATPITAALQPGWIADAGKVAAGELALDRLALASQALRITFPMTGVLVLSAWALGVLNSHRRFLLPYLAPVLWNVAIVAALAVGGALWLDAPVPGTPSGGPLPELDRLLFAALSGALVGAFLQLGVQLPTVFRVVRGFRPALSTRVEGVRHALAAFGPVLAGRGVYQLSGYLDLLLAGFLTVGAISALTYAQVLYTLPVSLFAMSVAASELPELSRLGPGEVEGFLTRLERSLRQILYMIVATVVAYVVFGPVVVGTLYQTGSFGVEATWQVALVLGAYALGLVATTTSRLLQNAFYALDDTRTPARVAAVRVAASAVVGAALMITLDGVAVADVVALDVPARGLRLGAVGLALGSAVGAWLELWRLVAGLQRRVPAFRLPVGRAARMVGLAVVAASPAALLHLALPDVLPVWLRGLGVLAVYGGAYLGLGHLLGFEEGEVWIGRVLRRLRRRRG